jgi:hypothetical protein
MYLMYECIDFLNSVRGREIPMKSAKMQKDAAKLLPWLADRGCPVDIVRIESPIRIEQKNGDDCTQLFELPDGRTGCILDLRTNNEGPGPRSIRELEFKVRGLDFGFQWLQDPRETGGQYRSLYRFPGESLEFSRDIVSNHLLLPDTILQPNHPKSGLLLGVGNPLPPEIRHGTPLAGVFRIITDTGIPGICEIELWAVRMSTDQERTKQRRSKNAGLFEREPGFEDVSAEYK